MNDWKNILIFGMGLMGGSLSLAIKKKFPNVRVTGVVRSENSKKTIQKKNISHDVLTESEFYQTKTFSDFDFVVFSTPVKSVIETILKLPKIGTTVYTDLGSTKETILTAVNSHFDTAHQYISSHPMCGSEHSGPEAAKEDLYQDKLCIVTKPEKAKQETVDLVRNFWETIGSWTLEMGEKEHDETLSYLSHLPHILSTLLVNTAIANPVAKKQIEESTKPITGGGFRDMSRIAGSNPEMWLSIFEENRSYVFNSLSDYKSALEEVIEIFNPDNRSLDLEKIKAIWEKSILAKEIIQKNK